MGTLYRIVAELGPVLGLTIHSLGDNLIFDWNNLLNPAYTYTLESAYSLPAAQWTPLPGATWPMQTNHWVIPKATDTPPFYRVRAQFKPPPSLP
jgi:hypothetical protein